MVIVFFDIFVKAKKIIIQQTSLKFDAAFQAKITGRKWSDKSPDITPLNLVKWSVFKHSKIKMFLYKRSSLSIIINMFFRKALYSSRSYCSSHVCPSPLKFFILIQSLTTLNLKRLSTFHG